MSAPRSAAFLINLSAVSTMFTVLIVLVALTLLVSIDSSYQENDC